MTKPAARITDSVQHIPPPVLTGGPVSPNVLIGGLPAWLGVNPAAATAIKTTKQAADIALEAAEQATLAATGTPAYPGLKAVEEALKVATAASLGGLIAGLAVGASVHTCATPYPPIPHGPGVVVDGSTKVLTNNLPACFQGNTLVEALGPANQIAMGCPQVLIGTD